MYLGFDFERCHVNERGPHCIEVSVTNKLNIGRKIRFRRFTVLQTFEHLGVCFMVEPMGKPLIFGLGRRALQFLGNGRTVRMVKEKLVNTVGRHLFTLIVILVYEHTIFLVLLLVPIVPYFCVCFISCTNETPCRRQIHGHSWLQGFNTRRGYDHLGTKWGLCQCRQSGGARVRTNTANQD